MKDQINIDGLFRKAANQPVVSSFGETRELFLSTVGTRTVDTKIGNTQVFTLKRVVIMLSIFSAIIVGFMFLQDGPNKSKKEIQSPVKETSEVVADSNVVEEKSIEIEDPESQSSKEFMVPIIDFVDKMEAIMHPELKNLIKLDPPSLEYHLEQPTHDQAYLFPILTEDEIAANHKRKKKMLKVLSKLDKKWYAYIPSGSFDFHGTKTSVQSFYMQTAEVSNIQYKTFLFDLLIHGKKDDFLKAKPDQGKWTEIPNSDLESMKDLYFSDEAYDDYPVVNVSREGAEMYCVWLSTEIRKFNDGKNTASFNDLRLPHRSEWELAASESGKLMPFPWGGPLAQNAKGCFLANFDAGNYESPQSCENCTDPQASIELVKDGAMHTAKTKTYNPNSYGLYNLSGNVAEMVYNKDKTSGTAGGGWMSAFEEIKINGTDKHSGVEDAHPNIGFRVVMTHLNSGK